MLRKEINSLKFGQTLLNSKKAELAKLENQLNNQQTQPENKTKVYWGVGCGVLGVGLVGLVAWLSLRKKVKE